MIFDKKMINKEDEIKNLEKWFFDRNRHRIKYFFLYRLSKGRNSFASVNVFKIKNKYNFAEKIINQLLTIGIIDDCNPGDQFYSFEIDNDCYILAGADDGVIEI